MEYLDVFDEKYPQLKLSLSRQTSDQAIRRVLSGELTAAMLMMMSCEIAGISGDVIYTYPMGLTYCETHRFAKKERLFINDLEDENCIVWGSPELFMKPLNDALAESGIHINIEVVPSAKTAFYLMEHEGRVMIEYGYPKTRQMQIEYSRPFVDRTFFWNLTLVRKATGSDPALLLLKDFLLEKYNGLDKFRNQSTPFSTGAI